ncbi:MAG: SpoIIE family protein phosphatase [Planctomycetes bacterium]|nr:SpoIIE family protein phosphatase [Planctomycetota bacterium]
MGGNDKKQIVLVVDDKPENIRILTSLLKGKYRVMAATGGQKALEIASSETVPDLILLDVMMPKMDGHEVCRRLKADEKTREIPVIFITAMSEVKDETQGFELGAVDYIAKPFNPTIVDARVRTHLDLKEKNEIIKQEREQLATAHRQLSKAMSRVQADIQLAADVQRAMLPREEERPFPQALTIVSRYSPEMDVGGDFFDFKAIDDRHAGIILADVCGHGLQAAFITGLIKTSFELAGETRLRPVEFATNLNKTLYQLTPPNSFATVAYCVYNTEEKKLCYFNAGHAPLPILISPEGETRPISNKTNIMLGIAETESFAEEEFPISPGTKLLLATDGLVDALDSKGDSFGYERLMEIVRANAQASAGELDRAVFEELTQFTGNAEQNDDIATISIEFH